MLKTFERFGRYVTFPFGFLLSALISRNLGVDAVGAYNYWGTVISLSSAVALFGTGQSMWSLYSNRTEEDLSLIFFQFFLCSVPLVTAFVIFYSFTSNLNIEKSLLVTFSIFIMTLNAYVKNFEILSKRLHRTYLNDLVYYALAICFVLSGLAANFDILFIYLTPILLTFIIFAKAFWGHVLERRWEWLLNLSAFYRTLYALGGVFIGLAAYRVVIIYAGNRFTSEQLGYFTIIYMIVEAFVTLQVSLMIADMQEIRNGKPGATRKSFVYQLTTGLIGSVGLLIGGAWSIAIIYKLSAEEIQPLITPFSIALSMSANYKFVQNYALAKGRDVDYLLSNIGLLVIMASSIAIIRPETINGLAWCYALGLILAVSLASLKTFRHQHVS